MPKSNKKSTRNSKFVSSPLRKPKLRYTSSPSNLVPRCVNLSAIQPNFYLCNLAYIKDRNIKKKCSINCAVLSDDGTIAFDQFNSCINNLVKEIQEKSSEEQFFVYCNKGINRSVATTISYAMTVKQNETVSSLISYIKATKLTDIKSDSNWQTLTNSVFSSYLENRFSDDVETGKTRASKSPSASPKKSATVSRTNKKNCRLLTSDF